MENNKLALRNDEDNTLVNLESATNSYCSFVADTEERKKQLFKVINNTDKRISDCINMKLCITDVYVEEVQCINEETGEVSICPRVVLIDKDGIGFQSVSFGILSAVKKLFVVFGAPTWEKGIEITVKQIKKGKKQLLTFTL